MRQLVPQSLLDKYHAYCALVLTRDELKSFDEALGKTDRSDDANQQQEQQERNRLPILYELRRVKFCVEDLLDPERATTLREKLVEMDKIELAKRVWVECEKRDIVDFERATAAKVQDLKQECQQFDQLVASGGVIDSK